MLIIYILFFNSLTRSYVHVSRVAIKSEFNYTDAFVSGIQFDDTNSTHGKEDIWILSKYIQK